MRGEAIRAVNEGMKMLAEALCDDPKALETVWLSVISFSTEAEVARGLVPVVELEAPELKAGGWTNLGKAVKLLLEKMEKEVRKRTAEEKGDWKPVVFILTDGAPTGKWEKPVRELLERVPKEVSEVVAVGCGPRIKEEVLRRLGTKVVKIKEMDRKGVLEFFRWVSQSVRAESRRPGEGAREEDVPEGWEKVK